MAIIVLIAPRQFKSIPSVFFLKTLAICWYCQSLMTTVTFNPLAPELFFFNFSTFCIQNVNNTETKQVSIMKQTVF